MLMKFPNGLDERRIRLIRHRLAPLLKTCFGYHALCYSVLGERLGMKSCPVRAIHFVETQIQNSETKPGLVADYCQLPIASDSVDLIMLPASLQLSENPHAILREAERVLIPEGRLIIIGRNPFSWHGLIASIRRLLNSESRKSPAKDITRRRLKDWFKLLGLDLEEELGISLTNEKIQMGQASKFIKKVSNYFCDIFCSYFILIAEKRVSTLTPIRPSWRRNKRLVPPRIAEPSVRNHVEKWCLDKNQ